MIVGPAIGIVVVVVEGRAQRRVWVRCYAGLVRIRRLLEHVRAMLHESCGRRGRRLPDRLVRTLWR